MHKVLYSMFTLCTYETRTRVIHNEHTQLIRHAASLAFARVFTNPCVIIPRKYIQSHDSPNSRVPAYRVYCAIFLDNVNQLASVTRSELMNGSVRAMQKKCERETRKEERQEG